MVQPIMGTSKVLYFRKLGNSESGSLVLQTEHSKSASRDREKTQTKFGAFGRSAALEDEVTISALQATSDPTFAMLQDAVYDDYPVEVWEVDLNKKESDQYQAEYRQGYMSSWEETAGSEEEASVEGTFMSEGIRQKGTVTLSPDQMQQLSYAFHDLTPEDVPEDGLADMVSPGGSGTESGSGSGDTSTSGEDTSA